jgi:hypothetical protein
MTTKNTSAPVSAAPIAPPSGPSEYERETREMVLRLVKVVQTMTSIIAGPRGSDSLEIDPRRGRHARIPPRAAQTPPEGVREQAVTGNRKRTRARRKPSPHRRPTKEPSPSVGGHVLDEINGLHRHHNQLASDEDALLGELLVVELRFVAPKREDGDDPREC